MYLTEKEIFSQYEALAKTNVYMLENSTKLIQFYKNTGCKSITFIGCGSSYSLSKSAALAAGLRLDVPARAFSAGDLLINFERFAPLLKDTLLVSLSRSGSTSEVILLVEKAKNELSIPCISICAKANNEIAALAELNLEIPWAFDESVCQTRCVTNLYLASMQFSAILAEDKVLQSSLENVIAAGEAFQQAEKSPLEQIAKGSWNKVVVLADGELEGIAEEGSLAFTEISLTPSKYFHVLDVRHGPIVLVDSETLVICALSPDEAGHQDKLLGDIKAHGATLVTFGTRKAPHADYSVVVDVQQAHAAQGIPFIFLPQVLSFYKALECGINPDAPSGLDPWIKL